ncbi:hypothetical protein A7C99_0106 [Trichophyton rubrum]|uniref:Uncharacterized protein n=1 Tax=Trichophyton rubrum TaxID=5551 RepID=A0A178FAU8_TRIRU|nr:hypothetical protein A7C99_0106 [Trichophyton rubrum]
MAAFRLIRFVRMCGIQSQTRRSDATGPQQTDRIRVPGACITIFEVQRARYNMASQSQSKHYASSKGGKIEIGHLSQELKELIDARQKWLISSKDFEQANPLENEAVLNHKEFKELIQKLSKVLSTYPETPNSTSEELHAGMFVKYQDEIYIDGALDFLLIRAAEPVKE